MSEDGQTGFAVAPDARVDGRVPPGAPTVAWPWATGGGGIDTAVRVMAATMMFVDIRDFSALSEQMTPAATLRLLDQYLQCLQGCVEVHGGRIDVLVGDGLLAVFEGRGPHADHARAAVRAAQAILAALEHWNRERAVVGEPRIDVGIGINTAVIACGHFRSLRSPTPRIAGSGVNVAARLQAICGHYGTRILIGAETRRRIKREFPLRLVDRVLLKGRRKPERIYEPVVDASGRSLAGVLSLLKDYHQGLRHLGRARYAEAAGAFQRVLVKHPADGPSRLHLERCRRWERIAPSSPVIPQETRDRASVHENAIVHCSKSCCIWSDSRYHQQDRSDG
jgi:class 3 adenylate cyclase